MPLCVAWRAALRIALYSATLCFVLRMVLRAALRSLLRVALCSARCVALGNYAALRNALCLRTHSAFKSAGALDTVLRAVSSGLLCVALRIELRNVLQSTGASAVVSSIAADLETRP